MTRPVHHPSDETLLLHAGGGLDAAFRAVVAAHVAGCPSCRETVRRCERVGGQILEELPSAAMSPAARARCLARLDAAPPPAPAPAPEGLPPSLAGFAMGRWRRLGPGIAMATLLEPAEGRAGLHMLRVEPGAKIAGHGHRGLELTAVLEGAMQDGEHVYRPGDLAETDEEVDHLPVAVGGQACVCLIAVAGKLRFRHWLLRLVQPWFGL